MSKKYQIFDLNKGLMSRGVEVFAASPTAALKAVGYENIERDYTGKRGNVFVHSCYRRRCCYVYSVIKAPQNAKKRAVQARPAH